VLAAIVARSQTRGPRDPRKCLRWTVPVAEAGRLALEDVVAIDVHTHVEMSKAGGDSLPDELRDAAIKHFRGESARPTAEELATYYRERSMMAVVFTVDAESVTGQTRVPNEEIAAVARANADVLIPFASVDPHKGKRGVDEARRLIAEHGVRGFKFHPNLQAFFPNDRLAYPLYEVIEEAGLPALFHTGHSGIGSGLPGGGGIRLKYSNPIYVDDVAADFPGLKIVLAHPSFPWQDEALSIAMHKSQVFIDLSGWSPKYFPPQLVHYANTLLREQVLFGTDYPLITPERWLADFDALDIKPEVRPLILKQNALRLLGLDGGGEAVS
jgi:predicted TIM-barrel fold metal-dependent hydrolase